MTNKLIYILIISFLATMWSLYVWYFGDPISNIINFDLRNSANKILPCNLCRYIRICTYPILVISACMILSKDVSKSSIYSIFSLSILWLCFSIYKYYIEHFSHTNSYLCTGGVDCSSVWIQYFGFLSLSLLSIFIFGYFIFSTINILKIIKK